VFSLLHGSSEDRRATRLGGPLVYLRPPRHKDWRRWAELRAMSREFLAPWEPTWPFDGLTRRAFRRRVRQHVLERRERVGYAFFIFRSADDQLLGGVTVSDVQRGVAQSCSLGYWIGAPYAHQGFMTAALRLVLTYVFGTLGMHRATAACLPANRASQGLLRKLGFREEGYAREYLRINGVWQDHVLFALLAKEHRTAGERDEGLHAAE
jgi:ribosomal-protein-alanine N-acetyltransferase